MESAFLPIHMVIVRKKGIVTPCEELLSFFVKFVWLFYYSTLFLKNKGFCKKLTKDANTFLTIKSLSLHSCIIKCGNTIKDGCLTE